MENITPDFLNQDALVVHAMKVLNELKAKRKGKKYVNITHPEKQNAVFEVWEEKYKRNKKKYKNYTLLKK